ncbi:MAG TPA: hypothetical protein VF384_18530 [Planctomycetota bacterium]
MTALDRPPVGTSAPLGILPLGGRTPLVLERGWSWLEGDGAALAVRRPPQAGADSRCRVHPFSVRGRAVLLVQAVGGRGPAVPILLNGRPVGSFVAQSPGDDVVVHGLASWRLLERIGARRFTATGELSARLCSLCRTPLGSGRAMACRCGALLHDGALPDRVAVDGKGGGDGIGTAAWSEAAPGDLLACASLSPRCPSCQGELAADGAWNPRPEEL